MFTKEDLEKIERAFSDKPNFETSTGFTGNKKTKKDRENWVVGKHRRQTDHLSNKQRKQLASLHQQVDEVMVKNSHITAKDEDKLTKVDFKKGENNNLGAFGIHGTETFEKYMSVTKTFVKYCFEHYEKIEHISDIKPGMYLDWMENMMKNGRPDGEKYSGKTISLYSSAILKFAESAEVAGGEYQRVVELGSGKMKEKFDVLRDQYKSRYTKDEYKRGKSKEDADGNKLHGYSHNDALRITKKANDMSPYHGAMYEVLSYGCPRHDELLGIKWRQIDAENNRIYLDDPNQTKGSRPRFIPISEKTSAKLQGMMDLGLAKNPDTRVWGSRMTKDDVYNLTKHLCREAHVGYSGVHDFRRAAIERHTNEIEKNLRKGKMSRSDLEKKFMDHVNAHPKLNPIEAKREKKRDENGNVVYKQVRDKDGNPRYHANGQPRMKADWVLKMVDGKVVEDHRYTLEEVTGWRIDKLINMLTSQILGHNRSDASSPYKNG